MNEQYSAKHGENLFAPTNRTTQAQGRIGRPIESQDGYRQLVDDLYFLLWEGSGSRLGDKPESFKAVNALRTDLAHDVEHGKRKKIKAKKKVIGATFKKYSGESSPVGLDPERFIVVQANLLAAVRRDLDMLAV